MTVYNVLENPKFVTSSLLKMIQDEGSRISRHGLASEAAVKDTVRAMSANVFKVAVAKRDYRDVIGALSQAHDALSLIKLPGDFECLASDELFLNLGDLPRLDDNEYEEKFYDLGGIIDKLKGAREDDSESTGDRSELTLLENNDEPREDFARDTDKIAHMIWLNDVTSRLSKISADLGLINSHGAAYKVERTIREIKNKAERS